MICNGLIKQSKEKNVAAAQCVVELHSRGSRAGLLELGTALWNKRRNSPAEAEEQRSKGAAERQGGSVRDVEVACSNHVTSTIQRKTVLGGGLFT